MRSVSTWVVVAALIAVAGLAFAAPPAGTEAMSAALKKNIVIAKELTGDTDERDCICKLIGDKPAGSPVKMFQSVEGGVHDSAEARTGGDHSTSPPTPQHIIINRKYGLAAPAPAGTPPGSAAGYLDAQNKIPHPLYAMIAALLAAEKQHWDYMAVTTWDTRNSAGFAGHKAISEAKAHCRLLEVLDKWIKFYTDLEGVSDAQKAGLTSGLKAARDAAKPIKMDWIEKAEAALKEGNGLIDNAKRDKIPDWDEEPVDDGTRDDSGGQGGGGQGGDGEGEKDEEGGYTLRTEYGEFVIETGGRWGLDGIEPDQPYWIGATPKVSGGYDDLDMVRVTYSATGKHESGEQLNSYFVVRDGWEDAFRLTAFVWEDSETVDFDNPNFSTATRLEIDDLGIVDDRSVTTGGETLAVSHRYHLQGGAIDVDCSCAPSTVVTLNAYRWEGDAATGSFSTTPIPLGSVTVDSSGTGSAAITVPEPPYPMWLDLVMLEATTTTQTLQMQLGLFSNINEARYGQLSVLHANKNSEFIIDGVCLERPIGAQSATLDFELRGFEENDRARIYATPRNNGAYDDNDAVQMTSRPVVLDEEGTVRISIPCTYRDGQAYRLTALVWPAGVAPNLANLGLATRLELDDLLPYFTSADVSPEADTLSAMLNDFGMTSDDAWLTKNEDAVVTAFVRDSESVADVTLAYELGVEGVFGAPVSVPGTWQIAPGDVEEISIDLPTATEPTVIRVTATFVSPTSAFPTKTRTLGFAAYPFDD